MNISPNEIFEKLVTLGDAWSEAHYIADLYSETKKTLLSKLMAKSTCSSRAAAETEALASDAYDEHIRLMTDAARLANKARVKYDSAKVYADFLRTQNANERAANRNAT